MLHEHYDVIVNSFGSCRHTIIEFVCKNVEGSAKVPIKISQVFNTCEGLNACIWLAERLNAWIWLAGIFVWRTLRVFLDEWQTCTICPHISHESMFNVSFLWLMKPKQVCLMLETVVRVIKLEWVADLIFLFCMHSSLKYLRNFHISQPGIFNFARSQPWTF